MNLEALEKIAQEGVNGGGESGGGWLPWVGAGGAALLAHSLMSPDEKEEKDESLWKKVMRWLTVAGAGLGGYYLADGLGGKSTSSKKVDEAQLDADNTDNARLAARGIGYAAHGGGLAAEGYGAYRTARNIFSNGLKWKNLKPAGKGLAIGLPLHGLGALTNWIGDKLELSALEKKRKLESMR